MIVQFVLQTLSLTGGVRVVFEHAVRLRRRGHEVRLLVPRMRAPRGSVSLGRWKSYLYERWRGGAADGLRDYGLEDAVFHIDPGRPDSWPEAAATFATAWHTAEWLAAAPARVGRRLYLLQQYEAWTEGLRDRVDATWRLPLEKVVIAGWLERLAAERFGSAVKRIPNGVDGARFPRRTAPATDPLTVGMLYDIATWKGIDDGLKALSLVHQVNPSVHFLLFGRNRMRHRLPPTARYLREPRQRDLPALYRQMDVFANSSHSEGFSLVTLEAMSSGCVLVATAVGEVPEMGRVGQDYRMVPAHDPQAMAREILALCGDRQAIRAIADAGHRLASTYTWERATDALERILLT